MRSILEIEKINQSEHLDIEFIVQNDLTVNIVQVRPIAAQSSFNAETRASLSIKSNNCVKNSKTFIFILTQTGVGPQFMDRCLIGIQLN